MKVSCGKPKSSQKYQNSTKFKPLNISQKAKEAPMNNLCNRCYDILEWKKQFKKYKPLSAPSKCIACMEKRVFAAYRILCNDCSFKSMKCSKCNTEVEKFCAKTVADKSKNNLKEIINMLKEGPKKTVIRKMNEGIMLILDETKGIIEKESGEVVVGLRDIPIKFSNVMDDEIEEEGEIVKEGVEKAGIESIEEEEIEEEAVGLEENKGEEIVK